MSHPSEKPLREQLRSAIEMRTSALRNGRSRRKDLDLVRAAMGRAEAFLRSYPVASDERVREWCRSHIQDVTMIMPGNKPTALARLIMDELKPA
jgi:hypothetical protein